MKTALSALLAACLKSGCTAMAGSALPPQPGAAPAPMLEQIRADAAQRAGVAESAVRVETVESVIWRDGSLGCPRPDMMYTQALVPGWRLRVAAGGQALHYHASRRGQWLWCPADRVQQPLPGGAAK